MPKELIEISDVPLDHPIYKVSNPKKLRQRANKLGITEPIYLSNRKLNKYMLYHPFTNNFIHFGSKFHEDYLYHNDEIRRDNFKKRNKKWGHSEPYSSAYLSFYLLW